VLVVFNGRHAFAALRFVSFGPSQKKEPLGGGEPRQDRAMGNKKSAKHLKILRTSG